MTTESTTSYSTTDGVTGNSNGQLDRLADTFSGKTVLISGGTGFLGKVLIEKFLRKCTKIEQLILLVRPKKGKEAQQRIEELLSDPLFQTIVKNRGMKTVMSKITTVTGDTAEQDLGLSDADRLKCQAANIVVHCAATVRFDVGMKQAVLINTRGTKYMLDLAKECPKLELFIHISTAYCHPDERLLEEKPYPPPADPRQIIQVMENIDDTTIDVLTPKLLGSYPNTYAYSKALAESLVSDAMETMPVIILRPSIVIPVYKEPIPGWCDNINGPMGFLIGAGKGVIRTMYGDDSGHADFIPVDCVVNVLMIATWDYLKNGSQHKVLNLTTSAELKYSWKEVLDIGREILETRVPLDNILWYPGGGMTRHRWLHRLRSVLYHWIPAIIIDTLLFCLGIKPVLIRVQRRISKGAEIFEFYMNNQWEFSSDFMQNIRKKLTAEEKETYKIDGEDLDIKKYFEDGTMAARRYILKEKDENLPRAMLHLKIMKYLDMFVKTLFYGFIIYWLYNKFSSSVIELLT